MAKVTVTPWEGDGDAVIDPDAVVDKDVDNDDSCVSDFDAVGPLRELDIEIVRVELVEFDADSEPRVDDSVIDALRVSDEDTVAVSESVGDSSLLGDRDNV